MRADDLRFHLRELARENGGYRPDGLAEARRLVGAALTDALDDLDAGRTFADEEFTVTLLGRLARRVLAATGDPPAVEVPRAWQVVRERRHDPHIDRTRFAVAGAGALVNHDLPNAVVSACTLLGRVPGPVERADGEALVAAVAVRIAHLPGAGRMLPMHDVWEAVGRIWPVRGRPVEARVRREMIDREAERVTRAVLETVGLESVGPTAPSPAGPTVEKSPQEPALIPGGRTNQGARRRAPGRRARSAG